MRPSKIGSALAASASWQRKEFDEDIADEGADPKRIPPDFIDRQEAEKRATKLISTIGRDNARVVCDTLRHGFSAGSWRILSEMQKQIAGG